MSRGTYSGTPFGFIQDNVYDQPGVNRQGGLYAASDINHCDAIAVAQEKGISVGLGVSITNITPSSDVQKAGFNYLEALLPTSSSTAANFGGIVVATGVSKTDPDGVNYVDKGQVATVLRTNRVGGRIWIKAENALTAGGKLYWIIKDAAGHGLTIGGFAGTALSADAVELTGVKIETSAVAGELALVTIQP